MSISNKQKDIWTEHERVEFKGKYYNIQASKIGPKPIQKPHIPIYLGWYSQGTFVRVANYATGWMCVIRNSLDQVRSNIDKIIDVSKRLSGFMR